MKAAGLVTSYWVEVLVWANGETLRAVMDEEGRLVFEAVPVGQYQMKAQRDGYATYELREVKVVESTTSEVFLLMHDDE